MLVFIKAHLRDKTGDWAVGALDDSPRAEKLFV